MWFLVFLFIVGVIIFAFSSFLPEEIKETAYQGNNMPQLPSNLNVDFILLEMEKVRQSPSMLQAYYERLRANFHTEQQRRVLEKIIFYNETVAKGVASQAEIYKAKTELEETMTAYNIARNAELRKKKELVAHLDLDVQIAQNELSLAELKKKKEELLKPSKEAKEGEKTKEKSKPTPEEWIARLEQVINRQIEDATRIDSLVAEHFTILDDKERQEKKQVDSNTLLSPEEKEERKRVINARYRNLRDDINRLVHAIKGETKKRGG